MYRQSDLRFSFQPLAGDIQFEVISFELDEAISAPFQLKLELISHEDEVDFGQLLDKAAIIAVCSALATLHTLFEALAPAYTEHRDSSLSQQWLRQLRHSLQVGSDDE